MTRSARSSCMAQAIPVAEEIADLQVLSPALFVVRARREAAGESRSGAPTTCAPTTTPPWRDRRSTERSTCRRPCGSRCDLRRARLWRRRCSDRLEVHEPRMERALAAARATIAEHEGRIDDAAEGCTEVAGAWGDWEMPFEQAHALAGLATLPPITRSRRRSRRRRARRPPARSAELAVPRQHPLNRCSAVFVVEVAGIEPACSSD